MGAGRRLLCLTPLSLVLILSALRSVFLQSQIMEKAKNVTDYMRR